MQVQTPKELIEILSKYEPNEPLLITWWSTEDVEFLVEDEDVETDKASNVWNEIAEELGHRTTDHVISYVNDELASMAYPKLEK